ncbi:hypothetical protein [Nonomuraea sp. NPDC005692]|uniref:hypothetical protein n=1 Tax=Nonomuraea sp. NPDC005692 TaxID=3157168 RepID=UPI0033E9D9B9
MSKSSSGVGRAPLRRAVAIAAAVGLVVCPAAGVLWFFADRLHVPAQVLQVLDQRTGVVGRFAGMALGAAALVVAGRGDRSGVVSTGDGARNVRMRARASGQDRVYQAGGDQTSDER